MVSTAKYKATLKVLLLGDPEVGKTSIVLRYVKRSFQKDYLATIGVEIYSKYTEIPIENFGRVFISWQIWDLAGHKRWEDVRKSSYHGAHGAIFVYDVSRRETYNNIVKWVEQFKNHSGIRPSILVANKIDLRETDICKQNDCVSKEDGLILKKKLEDILKIKVPYIEASAKEGINIDYIFELLAKQIFNFVIKTTPRNK